MLYCIASRYFLMLFEAVCEQENIYHSVSCFINDKYWPVSFQLEKIASEERLREELRELEDLLVSITLR